MAQPPVVAPTKPIAQWSNEQRLEAVLTRAAKQLPPEVGRILLGLIEPAALATMFATLTLWAAAHFVGAGELADLVLLMVGLAALGGVAIEAGKKLIEFGLLTPKARTEAELDQAASCLAQAISLAGVQSVLMILFRMKPGDTFKYKYSKIAVPEYSRLVPSSSKPIARTPGALFYKPKLIFTRELKAIEGRTNWVGDSKVGRKYFQLKQFQFRKESAKQMRISAYHESVHRFLTPKLQIFREMRIFLKQSAYQKSYILRYLEEALAETYGQLRVRGFSKGSLIEGLRFPMANNYEVAVLLLGQEARGIWMGPITVAGMHYNVYQDIRTDYGPDTYELYLDDIL